MASAPVRYGCYVGNIDSTITIEMLRQIFSQCGTILDASLNGKDTDAYRYGFIDFASESDRQRAFKLDGVKFGSRELKVSSSKGNVGKPLGFHQHHHQHQHSFGHHMHQHMHHHHHYSAPYGGPMYGGGMPGMGAPVANPQVAMLMQMIQSGAVNPANLTPEQQQMVAAHALASAAPPPMHMPPFVPRGGYGPRGGYHGASRFVSPNPPPSEETVKLREVQRKQYFDQVRKQAEKYENKLQSKIAKDATAEGRRSASADSARSSASSGGSSSAGEKDEKRQRTETM
jgi:hypothetical protein